MRFTLALHTDDGRRYGVTVPDLPGAFSAGDTFEEALESAREAIDAHCELLAERGEDLPGPSAPDAYVNDKRFAGAIWVVIDVDASQYEGRAEKINITLPARDLRRIDEFARACGKTRSGFLKDAAREAIARAQSPRGAELKRSRSRATSARPR
jgi:predicted RNase H-like HicB family nuclease